MKEKNAYEELNGGENIWKLKDHEHKYCNLSINLDYDRQYCILGLDSLEYYKDLILELYNNTRNDFIILENTVSNDDVIKKIEELNLGKMKCYSMLDNSNENLINFFKKLYKSCNKYQIISARKCENMYFINPFIQDQLKKSELFNVVSHKDVVETDEMLGIHIITVYTREGCSNCKEYYEYYEKIKKSKKHNITFYFINVDFYLEHYREILLIHLNKIVGSNYDITKMMFPFIFDNGKFIETNLFYKKISNIISIM
jgi:glutaredoxin